MSHSTLPSFDPLATHPFTNNSGLLPKPAPPSQFPHPIPPPIDLRTAGSMHTLTQGQLSNLSAPPFHAPQPKRPSKPSSKSSSNGPRPIFVPFRQERSSPELDDILLKKKVSDAFANKATWSIDQAQVPLPPSQTR
ncbi:uncharacterized protein FIBRA_05837 [Fibroporia radiculosa]|uniref:Uncharacterized protein n=1 Tax=Fibroporia radiculosa TaxID=599839 RepID=J4HY68_9APHY|nr:uncharacterized protein FIBRA_05837 [Fibroporia radiculosa]CCM03692.1 predicted protein [Fibroporia radiculosa]